MFAHRRAGNRNDVIDKSHVRMSFGTRRNGSDSAIFRYFARRDIFLSRQRMSFGDKLARSRRLQITGPINHVYDPSPCHRLLLSMLPDRRKRASLGATTAFTKKREIRNVGTTSRTKRREKNQKEVNRRHRARQPSNSRSGV